MRHPSVYFGIFSMFLVWIGALLLIDTEKRANRAAIRIETEKLARVLEESMIRSISEVDTTIRLLRITQEQDPARNDWPSLLRRVYGAGDFFRQAVIADASGAVIAADRGPQPPADLSLADREYFKVHARASADALHISRPELSPISGRRSIQLTRRLLDADGKLAGVIVVSLDPEYFTRFYRSIDLGKGGAVLLVGSDWIVRATGGVIRANSAQP